MDAKKGIGIGGVVFSDGFKKYLVIKTKARRRPYRAMAGDDVGPAGFEPATPCL